jgi:hypothetical protein
MLSSDVLEQLLHRSSLRDLLVKAAWPSLSTESKLQVIQSVQKANGDVSDSLLKLALGDPQPIIRYWALRYRKFRLRRADAQDAPWLGQISTMIDDIFGNDESIAQQARSDPHPLVRALASASDGFAKPDESDAQLIRLVKLRNVETSLFNNLEDIVGGFVTAIETRSISDEMLRDCMSEFLTGSWLREHLSIDKMSYDGWTHFNDIKQIKRLWEVTSKAGKRTAHVIGYYAPIRVEKTNVLDELFESLPVQVAVAVVNRNEPESLELAERVERNPERFAPELLVAINKKREREAEFRDPDPDELRERRAREALNRDAALMDVVLELRREVAALREMVAEKPVRRGLW